MVGVLRHNANRGCRTCTISKDSLTDNTQNIPKRSRCSILDKLKRERYLQTLQNVYHATAGKIGCLLKLTCELFSKKGEEDFIINWKTFKNLKNWSHLLNLI